MAHENYKGRPFVIVFLKNFKKRPPKLDENGNNIKDANGNDVLDENAEPVWHQEERVEFHDEVSTKRIEEAAVILDVFNKKLIKNRFETSDENVFDHYISKYSQQVTQAMENFIKKKAEEYGDIQTAIKETEEKFLLNKDIDDEKQNPPN